MNMIDFALICRRCFENDEVVVDDCCVHIVDENVIMFICHSCGYEEYISERKRFVEDRELLREKKRIEKELNSKDKEKRIKN